jgi:hypothetical protein
MADSDKFVAKAKVAGIVTDVSLSINKGSASGIELGDRARLFRAVDVIDPDTGERLGGVEIGRLNLKITLVSAKYSIATVDDYITRPDLSTFDTVRRQKTLTLDPDEEESDVVLTSVGESVTVRRREVPDDDDDDTF